jgi:hypothetical protein
LILLSGGEGVEHLAQEYTALGKPVIPMDLDIGTSRGDGSGGASRLFGVALAEPASFVRTIDSAAAVDLLDRCRTLGGSPPQAWTMSE